MNQMATNAKPRGRPRIQTGDAEIAGVTEVDLEIREDLAVVTGEALDSALVKEYTRDLAFNEDILTIVIGETSDANAENPVSVGVNGVTKSFHRGQEYRVARKFVDSLIKREDRIKTVNYKDSENVDQTKIERHPALKYAISVVHDPKGMGSNDLGRRWFLHMCKNAW